MFDITKEIIFYNVENDYAELIIKINAGYEQWLCGYVGVKKGWPYGVNYEVLDNQLKDPIHGGLTFSGDIDLIPNQDFWFIGFDCHHCGDTIENCNKAYVLSEIHNLAKQIK